ncbi:MAG: hypothetical protein GF329_20420 [Candidatus Lokiarchaeota archaeon]|nr:hypothetical protein [Candidatus Lokiarchaeota archaeon]
MNINNKIKRNIILVILIIPLLISIIFTVIGVNRPIQTDEDNQITFMTYNIHFGMGMDDKLNLERLAQNMLLGDPDIIGLQEVENGRFTSQGVDMALWLATRLEMYYRYYPAVNDAAFGVALLSRYPIIETNTYDLMSIQLERVLLHCKLQINSSFNLDVFTTHLGLNNENQTQQVQEILEITDLVSGPKILMGDFNMNNTDPNINITLYSRFNDTWWEINRPSDEGSFPSYPGAVSGNRIDYIFATNYSTIIDSKIISDMIPSVNAPWEYGSDHLPVVSTLRF